MNFFKWFIRTAWFPSTICLISIVITLLWDPAADRTIALWWFGVLFLILLVLSFIKFNKDIKKYVK